MTGMCKASSDAKSKINNPQYLEPVPSSSGVKNSVESMSEIVSFGPILCP